MCALICGPHSVYCMVLRSVVVYYSLHNAGLQRTILRACHEIHPFQQFAGLLTLCLYYPLQHTLTVLTLIILILHIFNHGLLKFVKEELILYSV